ncbi:hypothetical protein PanWU01x14_325900, partial [Parasponia andersonii]
IPDHSSQPRIITSNIRNNILALHHSPNPLSLRKLTSPIKRIENCIESNPIRHLPIVLQLMKHRKSVIKRTLLAKRINNYVIRHQVRFYRNFRRKLLKNLKNLVEFLRLNASL